MNNEPRRGRTLLLAAVAIAIALVLGLIVNRTFFREAPAPYFASDEEHFLFGSVGTEARQGMPYWIWLVLPRIFPEYLPGPGGYASLGMPSADGHEMPVGLSKVTVGFPRVGVNCAMCHTTSVRLSHGGPRTLVPAGPSNVTAPQQYQRFLVACASDPRFTAGVILAEIARNYELSLYERLVYRFVIIPRTRQALLDLAAADAWMDRHPDWGPGRVDLFNRVKVRSLDQPAGDTGSADMMPIWNMAGYPGRAHHWDGLNTSLREVVLSSAIADGTSRDWIDADVARWDEADPEQTSSLRRVQNYISTVKPPEYPLPIDTALAGSGAAVFRTQCAECHEAGGRRTTTVIPLAEIGTDRRRLDVWTTAAADASNAYGVDRDWVFSGFRTTDGYVAVPLDGVWVTAPYLHNGSVPTLADLLEPAEARPSTFWRGYDVFDPVKVGFVSTGPEAEAAGAPYETAQPGNGNAGHVYGTALDAESKRALIEFLKTL
jgi:mono/diheme cytochrome c family protein